MTALAPPEYVCPITKKFMRDPMLTRYGTHFERKAILEWLNEGNTFCPVTGNPLRPSNLVSDKTLQWKIKYWAQKQGIEVEEHEKKSADAESIGFVAVPPKRFTCPLTGDVMEDPVCTKTGLNFERKAILKWLDEKGDTCPVQKTPLTVSGLVTNSKLQWEIKQWNLRFGDDSEQLSELELHAKLKEAETLSAAKSLPGLLGSLGISDGKECREEVDVGAVLDDVLESFQTWD